jgi:hypothetical protein
MGHTEALDRYGYDKSPWRNPEYFRAEYMKAEPWLNILSQDPESIPRAVHEEKIQSLESKYDSIAQTVEELRRVLTK